MGLISTLARIWQGAESPFLIYRGQELRFSDIQGQTAIDLQQVRPGDVVGLIGDFNPISISTLLQLIDRNAIVVPLTIDTRHEHEYFFDSALVDVVIDGGRVERRSHNKQHEYIERLRALKHGGLVLFSTGTTGRPKAIIHDLSLFLQRFETPRPTLKTLNFLLFDHIGGINTLLHTLFNKGVVVAPETRTVDSILETCRRYEVEVLPTTPTFLRMLLMSGAVPKDVPPTIKVITYGTERMDQPTLDDLCRLLPAVDFRQTFGMSELGIVRVKSETRNSLFMKIGGEGIETQVREGVLHIRSTSRMLGYLNAPSPFDGEGWYDTKDVVEVKGNYVKVTGRITDVINVGGLKFMASDIERVALVHPEVALVKVEPRANPITGQHVEMVVQPLVADRFDKVAFLEFLKSKLQPHMVPRRIVVEAVSVGHRFKKT
jgi:long-chain acyl-CoA synthetase